MKTLASRVFAVLIGLIRGENKKKEHIGSFRLTGSAVEPSKRQR